MQGLMRTVKSRAASGPRNAAPAPARRPVNSLQRALGNEAIGRLVRAAALGHATQIRANSEDAAAAIAERSMNAPGQPLAPTIRADMESRFGHDFGGVRIHVGGDAVASAQAINAKAYTIGSNIAFARGQYAPEGPAGRTLLAHELAHVVQQSRGGPAPSLSSNSALEAEAAQAATAATHGHGAIQVSGASGVGVAREENTSLPWWKRKLNPLYQRALEVLPQPAAKKLEEINEVARTVVQTQVVDNSQIDAVVRHMAPVVDIVELALNPSIGLPKAEPASGASTKPVATPATPVAATPHLAPAAPDWTTQTEWVFETSRHSPFSMVTTLDTGNSVLNVVLNKGLVPWRNLLASVENMPFEMMGELDDAMTSSRFRMEWQAFQTMAPFSRAMGIAIEAPGALRYLGALASAGRKATIAGEEGLSLAAGARALPVAETLVPETKVLLPSGQLSLFEDAESALAAAPKVGQIGEEGAEALRVARGYSDLENFILKKDTSSLLPRQTSLFDLSREWRSNQLNKRANVGEFNNLMEFLYKFEPKAGQTYEMNGVLYTYDADRRLIRVATDKSMVGARWARIYQKHPQKIPGYDYGHVGGIKDFGTNDLLTQIHGGFPQQAAFNRTGLWRIVENRSGIVVAGLKDAGLPFEKIAEVRNFVNGIPSEWRIYVKSGDRIVYDSQWLTAPLPPP
ncbi:MAG: DUF4157 domain-containing protein [Xanthobacteraceae bacterium]